MDHCVLRPGSTSRALPVVVLLLLFVLHSAGAADLLSRPNWALVSGYPAPPPTDARSVLLYDAESRMVLYAENPEFSTPPASITKVVAIHTALIAAQRGELDLDRPFSPPEAAWWTSMPPHSSLMFLGPDQELTPRELLLGLAVPSGNDAATALALLVDGSVPAFADRMNREVAAAGVTGLYFVEPSGLSPANQVTAGGLAEFTYRHVTAFPGLLEQLYSQETVTYPQPHNIVGPESPQPIEQRNRNGLLRTHPEVDGLKTGYTEEAGYSLIATAERDGRRLVAIVLGVEAPNAITGAGRREEMAWALLQWGYGEFELARFDAPAMKDVRVYQGQTPRVAVVPAAELAVTVPPGAVARLDGRIERYDSVIAPVRSGAVVGRVELMLDGTLLSSVPLVVEEAVPLGGFVRRAWDAVVQFFVRLFGAEQPVVGSDVPTVDPFLVRTVR